VRVKAWCLTPLQRVLEWDKTIEGHISWKWKLVITRQDSIKTEYVVSDNSWPLEIEVKIWDLMQWQADTDLMFYEVCFPPYSNGRFQNL
jgi:hypothetical protein